MSEAEANARFLSVRRIGCVHESVISLLVCDHIHRMSCFHCAKIEKLQMFHGGDHGQIVQTHFVTPQPH